MNKVMILNPCAGHGDAMRFKNTDNVEIYKTKCIGDAEDFTYNRCLVDNTTHFIVCGGDGTINEVVNGIMKAGCGLTASFSVAPTGSGNDFVRNSLPKQEKHVIDLMLCNDRYSVNMINIGFDCNVVAKTEHYKKRFKGSTAYKLGVVNVLFHKIGENFDIIYTDCNDIEHSFSKCCTLCAIANSQYCGGGFMFAPLASLQDGLLDALVVSNVSRATFIKVIGKFKKGEFIEEDGTLKKGFNNILEYIKCKKITIKNTNKICLDGEISTSNFAEISVVPNAINYIS